MKVSQKTITDLLKKLHYSPKLHSKTDQIHASYKHDEYEYHLFIGTLSGGDFLQLITFLPCNAVESSINDLCRFLHIINKELDFPGFCYDEETKTIIYRIVLPTIEKEIHESIFEKAIHSSKTICETFGIVIQALAIGAMTLSEVFEKMVEGRDQAK